MDGADTPHDAAADPAPDHAPDHATDHATDRARGGEPDHATDRARGGEPGGDAATGTGPPGAARSPRPGTGRPRASEGAIWAPGTAPGAWVDTPRRPRLDMPHTAASDPLRVGHAPREHVSLTGLTHVLLLAYGATSVLLAAFAAALARRRSAVNNGVTVSDRNAALRRSAHLIDVTAVGVVAVAAATILVSAVWCWVAARNQEQLAGEPVHPAPLIAAVGWLVPVVNLLAPFRTVTALVEGPDGDEPVPLSVSLWWLSWLGATGCAGAAIWQMNSVQKRLGSTDFTMSNRALLLAVAGAAIFLSCFSQANVVFRHIARRQHDLAFGPPPPAAVPADG